MLSFPIRVSDTDTDTLTARSKEIETYEVFTSQNILSQLQQLRISEFLDLLNLKLQLLHFLTSSLRGVDVFSVTKILH